MAFQSFMGHHVLRYLHVVTMLLILIYAIECINAVFTPV